MKCGVNKFCVGFEANKVYCYGSSSGCLWSKNDCNTDGDCSKKYTTLSLKFTNGDDLSCVDTSVNLRGWRADACKCPGEFVLNIIAFWWKVWKSGPSDQSKNYQKWPK